MEKLFESVGIRGRANRFPILPETLLKIGQAVGQCFRNSPGQPKIVIGKDTRRSGYMIEQALSSGVSSVGSDVCLLGPIPTPGLAYLTKGLRASAGIMISSGDDPFYINGIKIFTSDGKRVSHSLEIEIESLISNSSLIKSNTEKIGRSRRIDDAIGQYSVFLKEQFPKHLNLEGLRIAVDCANGAGYKVAPKVLGELGAEIIPLNTSPDGTNINQQCGAFHLESIKKTTKPLEYDVLLALDGAAERVIPFDEKGQKIDGDHILAICGIEMLKKGTLNDSTVVSTVASNGGLDIALQNHGGTLNRVLPESTYVTNTMVNGNFNLGGLTSGHIFFGNEFSASDGILASLNLFRIMLESEKSLSDLRKQMMQVPQYIESFTVERKVPLQDVKDFAKLLKSKREQLGKLGRIDARYSNTENTLKIIAEGESSDIVLQAVRELGAVAQQNINTIFN